MKSPKVRGKMAIEFQVLQPDQMDELDKNPVARTAVLTGMCKDAINLLFMTTVGRSPEDKELALKLLFAAMTAQFKGMQEELKRAEAEAREDLLANKEPTFTPEQESQAGELATEYLGKIMKGGAA